MESGQRISDVECGINGPLSALLVDDHFLDGSLTTIYTLSSGFNGTLPSFTLSKAHFGIHADTVDLLRDSNHVSTKRNIACSKTHALSDRIAIFANTQGNWPSLSTCLWICLPTALCCPVL